MAPPKAKGQKMALGEFLTDTSLGSWADEMEDIPVPSGRTGYGTERSHSDWGRGGAHSDRGYAPRESLPLPTKPPFTVHLGNMSFDATEGDIFAFFEDCQVTNVRIVEDKLDRKPKGFGYAEFATLEGLKKALEFNGTQFQGRNIRVSVAEPQKERAETRELLDWTRKGPLPDMPSNRGQERAFSGPRGPDYSPEVGIDRPRRPGFEQNDGKHRDFSNWERKGPLTPTIPHNTPNARGHDRPPSHDGPRDRRNSPAWGEGRSQDGSRPPRRDLADRPAPERVPTAAELDTQWRLKMRPDPPLTTSEPSAPKEMKAPSSPAPLPAALTTRPKLNLQKRTVSQAEPSPALSTGTSDAKASPFGAARPIDTAAREREIEEKIKQRKEQEDKLREEKRVAEEKGKEKRATKESMKSDQRPDRPTRAKANGQPKEGDQEDLANNNYQILRREAGDNESEGGSDRADFRAAVIAQQDKSVKPQEIVKDTDSPADATASAEQLQEEGWSTVSKPSKGRRGGNSGTRAIAS